MTPDDPMGDILGAIGATIIVGGAIVAIGLIIIGALLRLAGWVIP